MALHLPKKPQGGMKSPYEALGLRDCPFPSDPVLNPYSTDDRNNGAIYAASIAQPQIEKFEKMLIRPDDFPNRVRLAYLWAKGDRESGRGMGKTALLRYFRQRINKDWGQSEFNGQFSAAVVYVSFALQVDRRYMEQLALAALVDICKTDLLPASRAALRAQSMSEDEVSAVITNQDGTENLDNLLDDAVLMAKGINAASLDQKVVKQLTDAGVESVVATALANGEFENHLRNLRKDHQLEPLYVARDTKILEYSRTLLFNDMVNYLRTAGYAGGYLFIDDIENLVDQMTRKERIEFAKNFGLCTVRPGYANTTHKFFSCVLTTHQQASVGLSQAWGEAGLSAIARLDPGSPQSVELPLPSKDQAKEIIVAHLDHYRMNNAEAGSIKPFTEDGMEALLKNREMLHPRVLLSKANDVVVKAVEMGQTRIDEACVTAALGGSSTNSAMATTDLTEGIEGAL